MKWTQQLVWKAIGEVLPSLIVAKEAGHYFNLPSMLKNAAVEFIMRDGEFLSTNEQYAKYIIKTALIELRDKGFMEFGNIDKYWM